MPGKVYEVEDGFAIKGIEPPGLRKQSDDVRRLFWGWALEAALKQKDRDLSMGLDKDGKPLRAISAATRKHRHSEMTPSGQGDPSAPPLEPGLKLSRVRSLLTGRAEVDHIELWWKFDPFTGDSFARVLEKQREQGRDVFGLSPAAIRRVMAYAWDRYKKWEAGKPVELPRPIGIPQARAIVAAGSTDTRYATFGIGRATPPAQWSGGMRAEDWRAHFRQTAAAAIPHREPGPYNRILGHIWGQQSPPAVAARAALKPAPAPPKPKVAATPPPGKGRMAISAEWRASLTKDERAAIGYYVGSGYLSINPFLRKGTLPEGTDIAASVAHLDRALARARLDRAYHVWRGVRDLRALGLDPDNLVGAELADPAFLSTSFDKGRALSFVQGRAAGALFRILAPEGAPGAFVGELANLASEQEVLFARRPTLRIVGSKRDKAGVLIIEAELIHGR